MNCSPPVIFQNTFVELPPRFYTREMPTKVPAPELIKVNESLANQLGIDPDWLRSKEGIQMLAGNCLPSGAEPIATVYAGHQFGGWNPQLGDGRAILLGEVVNASDQRFDIQLKGAGQTPYSRMGDGRSPLGPVLREYIVSEGMAAIGIPSTRSLAAVTTGEKVYRNRALPGAILTRVARSHIRVGHFQYFSARQDSDALKLLADHVIARDFPHLADKGPSYALLLEESISRQARLIAQWMSIGFIHGVMNTDNMLICGETIDYGPCAFMDFYDPGACYSSIDHGKRYAYKNQPAIAHWNLSWFAQALLPLIHSDEDEAIAIAQSSLNRFPREYEENYLKLMHHKFGLEEITKDTTDFIDAFMGKLSAEKLDFTLTFRHLADLSADSRERYPRVPFRFPASFNVLIENWQKLKKGNHRAELHKINPAFIPRNHLVEQAIVAAESEADYSQFHRLVNLVSDPFEFSPEDERYCLPPEPDEVVHQTFCGT